MSVSEVDEAVITDYFVRLDRLVKLGTELYVIGGSAIALLGAKIRTTADIDVALPYSKLDLGDFSAASEKAGLPVNPAFGYQAGSCDYGMRGFIDNVRRRLNRPQLAATEVPPGMVKDVVLPKYRVPEW